MRRDLRKRYRSGAVGTNELQQRILGLARQFEWIDFGYVPRRKNQIAHNLAGRGRLMKPVSVGALIIDAGAEQALGADSP